MSFLFNIKTIYPWKDTIQLALPRLILKLHKVEFSTLPRLNNFDVKQKMACNNWFVHLAPNQNLKLVNVNKAQ